MFTMQELKEKYPKTTTQNRAVCGNIPMADFVADETEFQRFMRENKLKAFYRGPRRSNKLTPFYGGTMPVPSMTRRCDATSVLLYRK
jgi:hypothetical protein